MSKRCPECRYVNEDSRIFCAACGAALDAQIRLIQGLEKQKEELSKNPSPSRQRGDVSFYGTRSTPKKKEKSSTPWVILALVVIAVAAWFFLKG